MFSELAAHPTRKSGFMLSPDGEPARNAPFFDEWLLGAMSFQIGRVGLEVSNVIADILNRDNSVSTAWAGVYEGILTKRQQWMDIYYPSMKSYNSRFAPSIQPFSLLLKFLKAAGGLMQAECPAWGWETNWQMPGGYAGKAALHLVNELRLYRAQSGPHLQKDRTGWKENHNTSVCGQRNAFFARGDATPRMGPLLKESFPANA